MSGKSQSIKITDKAQLVDWLKQQEADAENWLIGTEHEKFLFQKGSFRPVSYEGKTVSYTHLTLPTKVRV